MTDRRGGGPSLADLLRVIVITDPVLAAPHGLPWVVERALEGGARTIQLRDKKAGARELLEDARRLLALTRPAGALLIVNDRLDVALAADADGVHLGPDDLPVDAARAASPEGFVIGYSTDRVEEALAAQAAGADYLGCGAVFGTTSKDVGDEAIGLEGLDRVARAVSIPVVGIGGVTPHGSVLIARETRAAGVAAIGAVMTAEDPCLAVEGLLAPFHRRSPS